MVSIDKYLLDIVGQNWMTMYVVITLLKGIALATPTNIDNSIVKVLSDMFGVLRSKKLPEDGDS